MAGFPLPRVSLLVDYLDFLRGYETLGYAAFAALALAVLARAGLPAGR
jgi:hypothetical protein